MSAAVASSSRAILRRQPLLRQQLRRYADSTADKAKQAAEKAKEGASNATSKASEGLSRVSSSASSSISKVGSGVSSTLSKIGGRTGRLIAFVESLIPPTIYYSKVGLELAKLIAQGQKFAMPTMQDFQATFSPLLRNLRNPTSLMNNAAQNTQQVAQKAASNPEGMLERLRNTDRTTLARGGILTAEVLGFFTVGEMLGRLKVVGYHGEVDHSHH